MQRKFKKNKFNVFKNTNFILQKQENNLLKLFYNLKN